MNRLYRITCDNCGWAFTVTTTLEHATEAADAPHCLGCRMVTVAEVEVAS